MDERLLDANYKPPQIHGNHSYPEGGIELSELIGILWAEKILIAGVTFAAAVLSVIYSLMMTDIYTAESVLAAADAEQSAGLSAQLGGAAALLGVNVGGSSGDNINTAIATLRSRQFIGRFIDENELLVPLFASSWDKREQRSVIDERIYDPVTGDWLSQTGPPSAANAYRSFSGILTVAGPDRNTGIVTVSINWHNPHEAALWVNQLVRELNHEIRARDVREANNAINYLRSQLETTQLVDMQRVFYQLIESQTRVTMLADVRDEYVFRVIDPAVVPDRKSAPRRSIISIIGTLAGGMLALILVFIRRILWPALNLSKYKTSEDESR
jgi:uncharacterized protein involved in exopolysaccharide biosynthesis